MVRVHGRELVQLGTGAVAVGQEHDDGNLSPYELRVLGERLLEEPQDSGVVVVTITRRDALQEQQAVESGSSATILAIVTWKRARSSVACQQSAATR